NNAGTTFPTPETSMQPKRSDVASKVLVSDDSALLPSRSDGFPNSGNDSGVVRDVVDHHLGQDIFLAHGTSTQPKGHVAMSDVPIFDANDASAASAFVQGTDFNEFSSPGY